MFPASLSSDLLWMILTQTLVGLELDSQHTFKARDPAPPHAESETVYRVWRKPTMNSMMTMMLMKGYYYLDLCDI